MKKGLLAISLFFVSQAWALTCSAPVMLSQPGKNHGSPKIAVNKQGEAVVLWRAKDLEKADERVIAAVLGRDKKWDVADLSVPSAHVNRVVPFIDVHGNVSALWMNDRKEEKKKEKEYCEFAKKEKDQPWSSPIALSRSDETLKYPKGVFDSQGNVILYGTKKDEKNSETFLTIVYSPLTGEKKVTELSKDFSYEKVVKNRQGKMFIHWKETESWFENLRHYSNKKWVGAWLQDDLTWSKPIVFSPTQRDDFSFDLSFYGTKSVLTPGGNLAIVVESKDPTNQQRKLQFITCIDHVWSEPVVIAEPKKGVSNLSLLYNDKGNALVLWSDEQQGDALCVAERCIDGTWTTPVKFDGENPERTVVKDFMTAMDDNGNILAVWTEKKGKRNVAQASYKPAGQNWSSAIALADGTKDCEDLKVFSTKGSFGVLWVARKGIDISIQGAEFSTKNLKWTSMQLSPAKQLCMNFSYAMNEDGKGVIAWETTEDYEETLIQAAEFSLD